MRIDQYVSQKRIVPEDRKKIHIVHIVDRSTSMDGSKLNSAIKGINKEIEELQKENNVDYFFTLVHFGSDIKTQYYKEPISNVKKVKIYSTGWTALYQAIGETLENYNEDCPVLVKIFTDGEENDSTGKYETAYAVKSLLDSLKSKNYTVTFVGTEYDVKQIQKTLSISEANTLVHNNTAESISRSFTKSMAATKKYSNAVANNEYTKTLSFYAD